MVSTNDESMKTKYSFFILPLFLLLLIGFGPLFQLLSEKKDSYELAHQIEGHWTAYEYYDSNIKPKGELSSFDYSQINQINKLITFNSIEKPCSDKLSKIEQRLEYFKINFKADAKAEIYEKQFYKKNSFDSGCQQMVYDESYNQTIKANWELDLEDAKLILNDSTNKHLTTFQVLYLADDEMHLSLKKGHDFILVRLHKDK